MQLSLLQVREKTDKFQQRSLDGFFRAGLKSCTEEACADRLEQQPEPAEMHMPDAMAMEVEMEVPSCIISTLWQIEQQLALPVWCLSSQQIPGSSHDQPRHAQTHDRG